MGLIVCPRKVLTRSANRGTLTCDLRCPRLEHGGQVTSLTWGWRQSMDIGTGLAIAGLLAGVAAVYFAVAPQRLVKKLRSIDRFLQGRRHLKREIGHLFARSLIEQEHFCSDTEIPLLTKERWIPSGPLPLDSISLRLRSISATEQVAEAKRKVRHYLPRRDSGGRVDTYSEAVGLFDQPEIWFDSCSYRLLEVNAGRTEGRMGGEGIQLTFGLARYFDGQDTSEFLAYEAADRDARTKRRVTEGGYRNWLADPFDLGRRSALPGISALTLRCSSQEAFFFMLRRDGEKVAYAMNATGVVPAGEFQPHNDILPVWLTDLDLWRTVMREYAEELLGYQESMGRGGAIIDYENDEPYRQFSKARRSGDVTVRFLGLGIDSLSWKPLICLVCIWKDSAFDRIFKGMTEVNQEGIVVVGEHARRGFRGIRFNASNVLGYAGDSVTEPPARACLTLAWRWRHLLQIPGVELQRQLPGPYFASRRD